MNTKNKNLAIAFIRLIGYLGVMYSILYMAIFLPVKFTLPVFAFFVSKFILNNITIEQEG